MPAQHRPVNGLYDLNQQRRDRETLNQILRFDADDSRVQTPAEKLAGVTPVNAAFQPGDVRRYGAKLDNSTDDHHAYAKAMQQAVQDGGAEVDGAGKLGVLNSTLTVPSGVTFKNFRIRLGTPSTNLLEVGSGCKIIGYLEGSGTTSTTERLIYPASNAAYDVYLDVEVSNATYGVHLQQVSGSTASDAPHRWSGRIYAHDIVGDAGVTEGYGLLCSPAVGCNFQVIAKNIARHAVYLSAGANHNKIAVHVDGCDNYAVQLFSTSAQDATENNDLTIICKNLGENVAGQGGAIAIVQKAHRNTVKVFHEGDGVTSRSILVEGNSGGPYPFGNKIVDGAITGEFTGNEVIQLKNADSTIVSGNSISAYSASRVIGMLRSGTNGIAHGGWVEGNVVDAQGQNCKGIYNEVNAQPSYIGPNEISNTGSAVRVDDQTSGWREGFSRQCRFSGTTASITAGAVGDTSAALLRDIGTTRRHVAARITDSSVSLSNNSGIVRIGTPADSTHVAFRIFNAHGADQTFNYEGVVYGD